MMGADKDAEIGSALWHRKVHHEVDMAVRHVLEETELLDPARLELAIAARIESAIQKAVAKIATPELVAGVIRRAFTKTGEHQRVSFSPPPMLAEVARQAVLDELTERFDVRVLVTAKTVLVTAETKSDDIQTDGKGKD